MSPRPILRRGRPVIEALAVDRIDAPELEPARFDPRRHVPDQAEVLPLIEAPHRGREDEHRCSFVAEDEQLHVAAQRGTPPLAVLAVHRPATARDRAPTVNRHAPSSLSPPYTSPAFWLLTS